MIKKIDTKIEIQQAKEPNFGPLFDGEDSSQVKLMSDEHEAVPDVQESKENETVPPLETHLAQPWRRLVGARESNPHLR